MKNIINTIKENKNALLVIGGIGATVAGVVMAKKATLKCNEIMKEFKSNEIIIEECAAMDNEYSEEDRVRDHEINRQQTGAMIIQVFAVPCTVITIGGCAVIKGSYKMIRLRKYRG